MAIINALKTGNWSDTTVWPGGTLPGATDAVHANGFTITIAQDIVVTSLNTTSGDGGAAGGAFSCVGTISIVGSINAGPTSALINNSTGTINITGNATGGGLNVIGALNSSTGTINITGNVTGGSGTTSHGAYNNSTGTINITGNVTGGSGTTSHGARNATAGGTITCTRATGGPVYTSIGLVNDNPFGFCYAYEFYAGETGSPPYYGIVYIIEDATNKAQFRTDALLTQTLFDSDIVCDWPAASDVRDGTLFDLDEKEGSCAVPAAGSVALGVPIDATTGTAMLTAAAVADAVWDAVRADHADAGSFGATSEWTGGATAEEVADAVWDELRAGHTVEGSYGATSEWAYYYVGSSLVTLTINDSDGDPLEGVKIEVWDETNATIQTYGHTDSNGQCVFALDDATYQLRLRKSGYSFTIPEELEVSGDTAENFSGTAYSNPGTPTSPDACRVYDYCFYPDGVTPLPSIGTATAKVVTPHDAGDLSLSGQEVTGTYSAVTGLLYWDITQGAEVRFYIPYLGINYSRTVPASASTRLVDISA